MSGLVVHRSFRRTPYLKIMFEIRGKEKRGSEAEVVGIT
jgi:hypothetical protein